MSGARLGGWMVMLSAVCFSAKAVFAKLAYGYGADAATVLTLRMAFALPFFLLVGLWSGAQPSALPFSRREVLRMVLVGSAGYYLASWLDFQGLQLISASLERLILFLYPTLVILFNVFARSERLTARLGSALAACYGGVLLVVWNDKASGGANVGLGSALVFGSAVAYAGYLVFSQPLLVRHGSTRTTSWILVATGCSALAEFALEARWSRLRQPWQVLALCAATALIATVLPAFLLSAGMRRLGTSRASLIATVGPVSTLLLAYWLLDEPITLIQVTGSALVLWGVLQVQAPTASDRSLSKAGDALS